MAKSILAIRYPHHVVHAVLFAGALALLALAALGRAPRPAVDPGEELWNGQAAHHFEDRYDDAFPARKFGVALWAAIDYVLFAEAQAGVVIGRDGWLYSDEEFALPVDAEQQVQRNLDAVLAVRDVLARAGIRLVVALVPEKARIYPEHLDRRHPPPLHQALYARASAALQAAGVSYTDLRPVLNDGKHDGPTYFRTDTHWTPQGAAQAARVIAVAVRRQLPAPATPLRFTTVTQAKRRHRGDLFNFLPLSPYFSWLLPPEEEISPLLTTVQRADDLLGDGAAPRIALVGTSYSANPAWNFVDDLRQSLSEDLVSYAQDGRGPFRPLADYLHSQDFRRAPPQLLIWELPERYLPVAQQADLPGLPSASDTTGGSS